MLQCEVALLLPVFRMICRGNSSMCLVSRCTVVSMQWQIRVNLYQKGIFYVVLSEIGPGGCLFLNITLFKWSYYFHTLWVKFGVVLFSIH